MKGEMFSEQYADGTVNLGYNDYQEGPFGGSVEISYTLHKAEFEKLLTAIGYLGDGDVEAALQAYFGVHMDKVPFSAWCKDHQIHCESFTWID